MTEIQSRREFSLNVRIWDITTRKRKNRPFRLRWIVGGREHGLSFATKPLADSRRSELWRAMQRGEAFHVETGLPESEFRAAEESEREEEPPVSWFAFCRDYVAARWPAVAAKTREGMADSLAAVTLALLKEGAAKDIVARDLRRAARWSVVPAHQSEPVPEKLKAAYKALASSTRPVADIENDPAVLRAVEYRLAFRLDGKPSAGETYRRRRRTVNTALDFAAAGGIITKNPLRSLQGGRKGFFGEVDRRVLVNAVQGRQLLAAVSYVGSWHRARGRRLVAFYAVMYYAALRPAEAVGLRFADCELPEPAEDGEAALWGTLTLRETRPVSGKQWTDSGERHDKRGLKARAASSDRPVPIPPVLVAILRDHLRTFGTAKGGRLFANERGDLVGSSTYWRVWEEARALALPPERVDSPLAGRPYDLRHACITRWLNAGVPIAEVARRVGNSPEVIHRRYHGCVDGHEEAANAKITKALEDEGDTA
ncbi:site-specific integrase [Streptomyces sp. DSM 44915]|uniref:Site-specific integrase n=1 Tax=Streptomyces chisholmiae TaxID=3075540 RepID=A0ABU2K0N8_9ACTN|nr:site-specific integrase [Streptomyces sp. DSM 44915]MDT0270023.1 site-specific integrase [Streptomyces sp. DSM 44915]